MKQVLYGIAALAGTVVLLALAVPPFLDWNQYKSTVTEQAEVMTGRKLSIDSDLSLSLLPLPSLSMEGVRLGNVEGAQGGDFATVEKVDIRVALLPLFTGEIRVQSLTLKRPVVNLEILPDGRRSWDMEKPAAPPAAPADSQAPPSPPVAEKNGGPDLRIDNLAIEDGTVNYRNAAAGVTETMGGVNVAVKADSLKGPYAVTGGLTLFDQPLEVDVHLGELSQEKAAPINATVSLKGTATKLSLGGLLSALSGGVGLRGKVLFEGENLAAAAGRLGYGDMVPSTMDKPFSLKGALEAAERALALNDMEMTLGDSRIGGTVSFKSGDIPRAEVALAFTSFNLDPWLRKQPAPVADKGEQPAAHSGPIIPEEPKPAAEPFTFPTGITGNLNISGDALTYRDGIIRDLRVETTLEEGNLTVKRVTAALPGGSTLSMAGSLVMQEGEPALDAALETKSDNLRSLLIWLGVDVSDVPTPKLNNFKAVMGIKGTPRELQFHNIVATLDTSEIKGAATARLGGRPAFGVTIVADKFNLDSYMGAKGRPGPATTGGPAKPDAPESPAQASAPAPKGTLAFLNDFDANMDAEAGRLTFGGVAMRNLKFKGSLLKGVLTLGTFSVGSMDGMSVALSGGIGGFGGDPSFKDFSYNLATRAAAFTKATGIDLPSGIDRLALRGTLNGDGNQMAVNSITEADGAVLKAQGTVRTPVTNPVAALAVTLSHTNASRFLGLFGDYRPADGNLGALSLSMQVTGSAKAVDFTALQGSVGPVAVKGSARLDISGAKPSLAASLTTGVIDLNRLLPAKRTAMGPVYRPNIIPAAVGGGGGHWSRKPMDLTGLKEFDGSLDLDAQGITHSTYTLQKAKTKITLANGILDIPSLAGTLFGGAFRGRAKLDAGQGAKLSGAATLANADLSQAPVDMGKVKLVRGILDFDASFSGSGASSLALVSSLGGEGKFSVRDGVLDGADLDRINGQLGNIDNIAGLAGLLNAGTSGGQTPFQVLDGSFKMVGGVARSDNLRLAATAAQGQAVATIDLPNWQLDSNAKVQLSQAGVPAFGVHLYGPLDAPDKQLDDGALKNFLISKGIGGVMKLLGKKPPQQQQPVQNQAPATGGWGDYESAPAPQQPQQQQQQQAPKPQDLIKDLFNQLGR